MLFRISYFIFVIFGSIRITFSVLDDNFWFLNLNKSKIQLNPLPVLYMMYCILHYCSLQAQIYEDEKDFIRKEINKQTDLSEKDVRHQPPLAIPYNPCSYPKSLTHPLTLKNHVAEIFRIWLLWKEMMFISEKRYQKIGVDFNTCRIF